MRVAVFLRHPAELIGLNGTANIWFFFAVTVEIGVGIGIGILFNFSIAIPKEINICNYRNWFQPSSKIRPADNGILLPARIVALGILQGIVQAAAFFSMLGALDDQLGHGGDIA